MDIKTQPQNDQVLLTWEAPLRYAHEHTKRWYVFMGSALGIMLLYSLWTLAWSLTLVLVIAPVTYLYLRKEKPSNKKISIGTQGFTLGEEFTAWIDCNGFWVIQTPDYSELHIPRKDSNKNEIIVLTGNIKILDLRTTLRQFLEEIPKKNEKIFDTISRICKL